MVIELEVVRPPQPTQRHVSGNALRIDKWRGIRVGKPNPSMETSPLPTQYHYGDAEPTWANAYLWPVLKREISKRKWPERRAFDLGCGNGATCQMLYGAWALR